MKIMVHKTGRYECGKCDFRTKYEYVLKKRHSQIHAKKPVPKKFKCEHCDYGTHVKGRFQDHMRKHTAKKESIPCDIPGCDFIANCKTSAYMRRQRVHWERIWYKCDQRSYQIWHKAGLTTHMKIHSEEKPFKCTFNGCDYRSKTNSALYGHVNRHDCASVELASPAAARQPNSETTSKVTRNLRRYPCTYPGCNYVAKEQGHLSSHLPTHDPNRYRPFKCLLCPKLLFSETSARAHMKTHTNEKPFNCTHPGCDHRAYILSELKKHERIHQAEQSFLCDYPGCNYKGTCNSYLTKHSKTHKTDRKPEYECSFCPMSFYTRGGLRTHIFSHTNEKPFQCSTCGYASIHSYLLKKHRCPENFKKNQKSAPEGVAKVVAPTAQLRKDGLYQCNFCSFTSKAMKSVTSHASSAHMRKQGGKPWNRPKQTD